MKNERGLILVVVLWALMALMVLSFELSHTMRVEALTALTHEQETQTYYLAQAGFHRAVARSPAGRPAGRGFSEYSRGA